MNQMADNKQIECMCSDKVIFLISGCLKLLFNYVNYHLKVTIRSF